ncbi:MAG: (E)-4-hydroxy-3-methylbut-2-enyl-diphosphate synthase [Chlamydiae bacterium]|nr:(E)-4-hydroxy-3-methylbut-2-enyl-diphosphate synthase [Chlamydiota bacterium]MBI3267164.1 (E)-4-hydroxy-3-methylbut-2-enyl-diphosphate synthase [Chlamydiota bacterium]
MGSKTRKVWVKDLQIGGEAPISVQSMCATRTRDIDATLGQIALLEKAGADLIRIAVDNVMDVEALAEIRKSTKARLVVDLQENFRLADKVAPHVDKMRYNPGHLHHLDPEIPIQQKVEWLVNVAKKNGSALRVGVNCGSVAPDFLERYAKDHVNAIVESAVWHCSLLDKLNFTNYVVSLKDSDPRKVVECNKRFSQRRPDVPIHLGVTEAGLLPDGIIKTRVAFEQLIPRGIGDTLRVSLTVAFHEKDEEIKAGRQILKDIAEGKFISVPDFGKGLNIISCPSCSRVENTAFVELAQEVKRMSSDAKGHDIVIAVMGCRVNGPGETDDADLGLWCGPSSVTLKRKSETLGAYKYDEVLSKLRVELDELIAHKVS